MESTIDDLNHKLLSVNQIKRIQGLTALYLTEIPKLKGIKSFNETGIYAIDSKGNPVWFEIDQAVLDKMNEQFRINAVAGLNKVYDEMLSILRSVDLSINP